MSRPSKVFFNGRLLPESQARVSVFDRGFLYGDGVYEAVRVYDGRLFDWPAHAKRLKNSAKRLALRFPWSAAYLEKAIRSVVRANQQTTATVRITISRGPGPLGLDPTLATKPTLAMMLHPDRPLEKLWREGVTVAITKVRRNHPACLDPQIKSTNSLNTILAKMESKHAGAFEAVLLNLDGYLTEGTISNIFFVKRGELFTPALSCGILEGVTRQRTIRLAKKMGLRVHEGHYTLADLKKADEIFLTSTTLEILPVTAVKSAMAIPLPTGEGRVRGLTRLWTGQPGPLTHTLHKAFRKLVLLRPS